MVCQWEPGTQYNMGCVVEYQGQQYKVIQPHTSLGDWTPLATPALWGKLPDVVCSDNCQPEYRQPPQAAKIQADSFYGEQHSLNEQHFQKVDIHHEEQKPWYDLDEKRKKQLEIGGGIATGLALLGVGYYAHHTHEKHEEQKKALTWALQKWIHDAQARTTEFYRTGPKGPVTWILTDGKNIPYGAVLGGEDDEGPIFIARAFSAGGLHVGKAGPQFKQGAVFGYKRKEIQLGTYEVLIGDSRAIRWVDTHGHLSPAGLGYRLVEGGYDETGCSIYIAQAKHKGYVCPGKASEALDGAYLPYGGGEVREKGYRVLAYA